MKSHAFRVVVEPDNGRWHAYCPVLEGRGAVTWGRSEREALGQVVQMVVDDMVEEGEALPSEPSEDLQMSPASRVVVNA